LLSRERLAVPPDSETGGSSCGIGQSPPLLAGLWEQSDPLGHASVERSLISNSIVNESLKKTPFFSLAHDCHLLILDLTR